MKEFLDGVVGVVEANSFESMCLWKEYKDSWELGGGGPLITVGEMDVGDKQYPVCIMLSVKTVRGKKILFLEATSMIVNWDMIGEWLQENLPDTAFNSPDRGAMSMTNAMNFHNLLH